MSKIHHVTPAGLSSATAQSAGMLRLSAVSGVSTGAERIWMGETHVAPSTASSNHHHGEAETAIFVRAGHPVFVFHDGTGEVRVETEPGDYVFVPAYLPHREENPDPEDVAVIVVARSTQEPIVIEVGDLRST
ncbi:cupin [Mycolicibacterium canariasense]|uniref:Cupin n=1 Tax=Mycolicibacterium canariasense TaxID=228230 RepID=A0A100WFC1_MYCCR|nr:cupin domain-containing protein [Mycolicibacterium canariasense]MCV7213415.1 cupin domain-containing protein [Mycolicibacterium canariasense]ORV09053.1 cupin [Mycolicibacterium canariasense]GAS97051.1 cupin [Mycolicibacterium canariasense]